MRRSAERFAPSPAALVAGRASARRHLFQIRRRKLICEECGREADVGAHGCTYLTDEEDGTHDIATYCPECARREFREDDEDSQERFK